MSPPRHLQAWGSDNIRPRRPMHPTDRGSKYPVCLRSLVPHTIKVKGMIFGTRDLKYWVLGLSGSWNIGPYESDDLQREVKLLHGPTALIVYGCSYTGGLTFVAPVKPSSYRGCIYLISEDSGPENQYCSSRTVWPLGAGILACWVYDSSCMHLDVAAPQTIDPTTRTVFNASAPNPPNLLSGLGTMPHRP